MTVQQYEFRPSPQGGGHFSSCERNGAALDQAVTLSAQPAAPRNSRPMWDKEPKHPNPSRAVSHSP